MNWDAWRWLLLFILILVLMLTQGPEYTFYLLGTIYLFAALERRDRRKKLREE
jgi:hypothetical protein